MIAMWLLRGDRGGLRKSMWVCCLLVGDVPLVELLASSRDGAGPIPTAYVAPTPKRKPRRHSCCERLREQVAGCTAEGGGGAVFWPGTQGAGEQEL